MVRSIMLAVLFAGLLGAAGSTRAQPANAYEYFDAPYGPDYEETMVDRMDAGIDQYFAWYNEQVQDRRDRYWERDLSSRAAYNASVEENRERLRIITGVAPGERRPVRMEQFISGAGASPVVAETDRYVVRQVRWPVLKRIWGAGLLLTPKGQAPQARVVALPDAGQTPEQITGLAPGVEASSQYARRLAESGAQVLVPALISRDTTYSVGQNMVPREPWFGETQPVTIATDQPHREWIYRQAYVMGRHVIGFEVQKVLAAVDWFEKQGTDEQVGVAGYGEGGLIGFYAAAMDRSIDATMISGYFEKREDLWTEPLYRNVWGLLKKFGDAEIASLVAPRPLVIEHSPVPDVSASTAAKGRLTTPSLEEVQQEVARLRSFFEDGGGPVEADVQLVHGDGPKGTTAVGSPRTLRAFAGALGMGGGLADSGPAPTDRRCDFDPGRRQEQQVQQMTRHLHDMMRVADRARYAFLKGDRSSPQAWNQSMMEERTYFYEEVIGRVPQELLPPNPRRRKVFDKADWTGYETVLDVWPGVFAWGMLAVPKGLKDGEKRPVVVLQHGIGGMPTTPLRVDSYNRVMPKLAKRGFIVFAPRNPYQFNVRRAMPLKASVFSPIVPQNQQIVNWLETLDHVDPDRIGFYGKSWGGRTALRVPALIDEFALSIASAYVNQWPRKAMTTRWANTYMRTSSIGVYEFNQGHTFGHAEMAKLIAPRPFMIESGYRDGVAPHEWVGYEFAKVKRLYTLLDIGNRAKLGFFVGGHEIDLPTTLPFLRKHLDWPRRRSGK